MGFYDSKGYWRDIGDGFYDAKGNWVSPGGVFYDSKGYRSSPGEGFYDSKGNWVPPGAGFYDGKGYFCTYENLCVEHSETNGIILFLLAVPFMIACYFLIKIVGWISTHLYIFLIGYTIINCLITFFMVKIKKYQGLKRVLSYIGNFLCIQSFVYMLLVYAIPSDSIFEIVATCIVGVGSIAIIQSFNYYHNKASMEFILNIVFYLVVLMLLRTGSTENTIQNLSKLYNVNPTGLAIALYFIK